MFRIGTKSTMNNSRQHRTLGLLLTSFSEDLAVMGRNKTVRLTGLLTTHQYVINQRPVESRVNPKRQERNSAETLHKRASGT